MRIRGAGERRRCWPRLNPPHGIAGLLPCPSPRSPADLTGTAGNDCAHGIASCSVVPTFLFAGKYADLTFETCGHNGTGWESTIGIEIEETTSSDQPYPQPLELNSDANSNRWTTRIVVLRADRRDLYAKNVNIHITVKCDIENRPCDRAFRYAIIDNKAQPR